MKKTILAFLFPLVAFAGDDPFLTGQELQAEVARNCAGGCVVLSRAEVAQLYRSIEAMRQELYLEAFKDGVAEGKSSCRRQSI